MKHVLIAGSSSFIGKAFEAWAQEYFSDGLQVSSISLRGNEWRKAEFSKFDTILFCCGIAHVDTAHGRRGRVPAVKEKGLQKRQSLPPRPYTGTVSGRRTEWSGSLRPGIFM